MLSLCSVPSTCLQTAISSSAKTARPRRGALNTTYWFPVLRLSWLSAGPWPRKAGLEIALQACVPVKVAAERTWFCRCSRCGCFSEIWSALCRIAYNIKLTRGLILCHIAYNINMTRGLTLCQISLHKSFHYAAVSAIRPHRTTFVEPRQAADFRSRVARRVRLVSRGSCSG